MCMLFYIALLLFNLSGSGGTFVYIIVKDMGGM